MISNIAAAVLVCSLICVSTYADHPLSASSIGARKVVLCATVKKIEQFHENDDPHDLNPWRITSKIESIVAGEPNDILKVGAVIYSRIHSPSLTFAAGMDEVQSKLVKMEFLNESNSWILQSGRLDPACITNDGSGQKTPK